MSQHLGLDWSEWNQHRLMLEVARVRRALERHATRSRDAGEAANDARVDDRADPTDETGDGRTTLEAVTLAFGLSPFERDIVLLCAGIELDARIAPLCAAAHGDPQRPHPTFGLALASLPDAHWSAVAPGSPLRYWRLIQAGGGESLAAAALRIDERVLHFLTGINEVDERLRGHLQAVSVSGDLPPSQSAIAERIVGLWSSEKEGEMAPAVQLCGTDPAGKRAIAAAACAAIGLRLYRIRAVDLPPSVEEREAFARLWEREVLLGGSALLVDWEESGPAEDARTLAAFVDRVGGILLLSGREPLSGPGRTLVRVDVMKPTPDEQYDLWQRALGSRLGLFNGQLREVVAQFDLPTQAIQIASRRMPDVDGGNGDLDDHLWEVCRAQARPRLDDLATRLRSSADWEDLVLPEAQQAILRAIATHVRRRARVYLEWGFAGRSARGLGISALFSGPSGTGKTLAAEVLARELRLDLYHIDLSSVVSKYIGETEKNLRRVFDAAEDGGVILLFDEADAIFGKRSEVKDSHDRYANLEVSYLLQRMEAYRGLAILTTNFQEALDTAFLRRIRFIVQFPFPDVEQRREIWRRIFPAKTPTEGLDHRELGRLNVAGGNIRNIALGAAFLAADAGEPVRMGHVLSAARHEYAKLERPVSELEIGGRT